MSASEKLINFTRKTEAGHIAVELLDVNADVGLQVIQQVDDLLRDFDKALAEVPTMPLITL